MPRRRETGTSESRSEQQRPRLSQTAPGTFTGPCPAAVTAPCRCSLARRDSSCDLRRGPGPALGGQSRARTPSHRRIVLACRRRVRTGTSVCADSALRLVTRHITSLRVTSRRTRNRQRRTLACLRVGTDAALAPVRLRLARALASARLPSRWRAPAALPAGTRRRLGVTYAGLGPGSGSLKAATVRNPSHLSRIVPARRRAGPEPEWRRSDSETRHIS